MSNETAKRILVIDDEPDVADLVAYNLRAKGLLVETLNNPEVAIGTAHAFKPDLVVLDIMMPRLGGIQICRMLRADPVLKDIPIIFLTAKAEEQDRIRGFETGGDDYITKPFSTKELVLRVQALLKRTQPEAPPPAAQVSKGILHAGALALDSERHLLTIGGAPVELTAIEFRLLRLLMERRGRVQSRDNILCNVLDYETETETRTVDTHVRRLRRKLGTERSCIETVRSLGYRFVEHPPAAQATSCATSPSSSAHSRSPSQESATSAPSRASNPPTPGCAANPSSSKRCSKIS